MSCVIIFNPHAGRGQALRRLRRFPLTRLGPFQLWPTSRSGHADELAARAAREGTETVIAAGGDGTVHEVANGLLTEARTGTALGIMPIGSANDYFHGVRGEAEFTPGAKCLVVDVGRVRSPGRP